MVIMRGREEERPATLKTNTKQKQTRTKPSYCRILNLKSRQALQTCRIKKLMKTLRLHHPQNH